MNAVIIYDDFACAHKTKEILERAAHRAESAFTWVVKPWRFDMLMPHLAADAALLDAAGAHLMVLALRHSLFLPPWLRHWLARWAERRQVQDAALALWDGGNGDRLSATAAPDLSQFAGRHGLNFIFGGVGPAEHDPEDCAPSLCEREISTTPHGVQPVVEDARPPSLLEAAGRSERRAVAHERKQNFAFAQPAARSGLLLHNVTSNQSLLPQAPAESPMIAGAIAFIEAQYDEKLSLHQVARAAHTGLSDFCKRFERATGLNFARYLARVRVEKAKILLLNPHYCISEIAGAVGFRSANQFHRAFKQFAGLSPTAYRAGLGTWPTGRARSGSMSRNSVPAETDLKGTERAQFVVL